MRWLVMFVWLAGGIFPDQVIGAELVNMTGTFGSKEGTVNAEVLLDQIGSHRLFADINIDGYSEIRLSSSINTPMVQRIGIGVRLGHAEKHPHSFLVSLTSNWQPRPPARVFFDHRTVFVISDRLEINHTSEVLGWASYYRPLYAGVANHTTIIPGQLAQDRGGFFYLLGYDHMPVLRFEIGISFAEVNKAGRWQSVQEPYVELRVQKALSRLR